MARWTDSAFENEEIAAVHRAALRSIARVVSDSDTPIDNDAARAGIASMLREGNVLVLTGAGVSTESGIPDYRGPQGALRDHRPMTYQEFMYDDAARLRYWARAYVGWRRMKQAHPNRAHYALAELQAAGALSAIVTQNVDGLHVDAGAADVLALHGDMSRVQCLACREYESRESFDHRLEESNPGYLQRLEEVDLRVNPDGDVDLSEEQIRDFTMVGCRLCGSLSMKPDVVYFGESVPAERKARLKQLQEHSSGLLLVGTSVAVMSGYKMVLDMLRAGKPVGVINGGPGRADAKVTYLWRGMVGPCLELLLDDLHLS